jgi:hypothetical protein
MMNVIGIVEGEIIGNSCRELLTRVAGAVRVLGL